MSFHKGCSRFRKKTSSHETAPLLNPGLEKPLISRKYRMQIDILVLFDMHGSPDAFVPRQRIYETRCALCSPAVLYSNVRIRPKAFAQDQALHNSNDEWSSVHLVHTEHETVEALASLGSKIWPSWPSPAQRVRTAVPFHENAGERRRVTRMRLRVSPRASCKRITRVGGIGE